jgi:undecaprenyl-diphosphatase
MGRRRRRPVLRLGEAIVLGTLHGPAELLPISSSAHIELVPWLLGWEYADLDPEVRKAFDVAVHAGAAAALLIALREEVAAALAHLDRHDLVLLAGSFAPPAALGLLTERFIEERLGKPRTVAGALLAGGLALAVADAVGGSSRTREDATVRDALALGLAQACALVPGVSRNGATLIAARLRGFARADANALSRYVALPVIAGAVALKGARLARGGLPPGAEPGFAGGVVAAFASTLASKRLVRDDRALWPFAAYRAALAAIVLRACTTRRP